MTNTKPVDVTTVNVYFALNMCSIIVTCDVPDDWDTNDEAQEDAITRSIAAIRANDGIDLNEHSFSAELQGIY